VGADEELAALAEFAVGRTAVPGENSACQWMTINADTPVLGKTLGDLDISNKYGVKVQAIRRDGKFIRSPEGNMDLKDGNQVLLCGCLASLNQLQHLFAADK
jgi:monovalent cation:H+ antiporter-2, CPA2 family